MRVEQGRFDLYLNRRHYTLTAGDIAFINPGTVHYGEGVSCVYECAVFRTELLLPQANDSATRHFIKPLTNRSRTVKEHFPRGSSPAVEACTAELLSFLKTPHKGVELAITATLFRLLYELYHRGFVTENSLGKGQARQLEQLTALLEWIEEHYTERISLADLSKASGLNEKYLCRFFKAYTSHSPIDYVNRLRVERAADDLRTGQCTVTEAAYANGFNDSAYFTKTFRHIKGISPTAYKKEANKNELTP